MHLNLLRKLLRIDWNCLLFVNRYKNAEFIDKRNWNQTHNSMDLAISLSLEASELLENFQWKSSEEAINENLENIKDEIADVVIYAILLSHELCINLEQEIKERFKKIIKSIR